jgi:hypothetical protein
MKTKFCICTILFLLFVTACSPAVTEPTSTPVDMSAVQTNVAETVVANITAIAAEFTPTIEATATAEMTLTPTITLTPGITATPTENACDKMSFVSDVTVPDNTEMTPGQEFVKTWKVKNTGACSWKTNYLLVFGYGNPAIDGKMSGQNIALTAEVLPGAEAEISVNLKAPTAIGTYTGNWRLQNNNGFNFGDPLIVVIVVK